MGNFFSIPHKSQQFFFFKQILAWYLDNLYPGETGAGRKWYFPFTREYWGFKPKNYKTGFQRAQISFETNENSIEFRDEDVKNEFVKTLKNENAYIRVNKNLTFFLI